MAERKIDTALIERDGTAFRPVDPMGKSTVRRLRKAMRAAADHLVECGVSADDVDGAMVAYGFRKGPFGGTGDETRNDTIARRLVAALLVEGSACVAENAVQRPSDIDALAVHGLGFPRRAGGPMRAMQSVGLIGVRKDLRVWGGDSTIWAAPDLLDQAIKDARGFDALG
jgi:3-hydroxyacyl-CoA dehydrogenase